MKIKIAWAKLAATVAVAAGMCTGVAEGTAKDVKIDGIVYSYEPNEWGIDFDRDPVFFIRRPGSASVSRCEPDVCVANVLSAIEGEDQMQGNYAYPVKAIATRSFEGCTNLTAVTIPDSVTSIGSSAFWSCSNLESVTIPDSVTSIGSSAFWSCSNLESVVFVLPGSLTDLGSSVFSKCRSLKSVTIPEGVKSIPVDTFSCCSNLESVVIPPGVTNIGTRAFQECISLPAVTIPNTVEGIGVGAFRVCRSLTSVTIPESVTWMGNPSSRYESDNVQNGTFFGCSHLARVAILGSLTNLPHMFGGCPKLAYARIGARVTGGVEVRFGGLYAPNLEVIDVDAGNPAYASTDGVLYDAAMGNVLFCPRGKEAVTISDGATNIAAGAFGGLGRDVCSNLTSVTIPGSMKAIPCDSFCRCSRLSSVSIQNGIEDIGCQAFESCGLLSLELPGSVSNIGYMAFYNCSNLTSVVIQEGVESIGWLAFGSCSSLADVWFTGVPPNLDTNYSTNASYHVFRDVPESARGHYTAKHAAEWKAVLDSDGKWQGLAMEEARPDYVVRLHGNGATTAAGEETVDVECWHGAERRLPGCPFRVQRFPTVDVPVDVAGRFMGWVDRSHAYAAETPRELWQEGASLAFSKEEAERLATQWMANPGGDPIPVIGLFAIWRAKVTVKMCNAGEKELSPTSLGAHVRWKLNTDGWRLRKSGETALVPPGGQQLLVAEDPGYESYVKDWDVVDTGGAALAGNGDSDYQFEISSAEGLAERELTVALTADAAPGTVLFLCEGKMTDAQRTGLQGFPTFAWSKAVIRVTRMGAGSAWPLEVEAEVPTRLPEGNYKAEYGYADDYWGAVPDIGYFSVTAGKQTEVPCTFMPYGGEHYYEGMGEERVWEGATKESPLAVPYGWLMVQGAGLLEASGGDFEAAAMAAAANGLPVWECYVAGLDPNDADATLRAEFTEEEGKRKVGPEGGRKEGRVYRVEGKRAMMDEEEWEDVTDVEDLEAEGWRFFRVTVELAE